MGRFAFGFVLLVALSGAAHAARKCDAELHAWVDASAKLFAGGPYSVEQESVAETDYIDFWDLAAPILVGVAEKSQGYEQIKPQAVLASDKVLACMENDINGSVDPEELAALANSLNKALPKEKRAKLIDQVKTK